MDIRQLQCFVAVAEELSFRRAAVRVHITQPPLSRQISQLEDELKVQLFVRSPHAVSVTAAGLALLEEARKLLALASSIRGIVSRASGCETGTLRIGFVGSTIYTSVPSLLSQYRREYPNVTSTLMQLTVARQTEMLLANQIDVGIVRQSVINSKLTTRSFFKERFIAAIPSDHPLASLKFVTLQGLAEENMVAFSRLEAPAIRQQMQRMCEEAGFSPKIVQEANPMSTVVGLVAAGTGIAIVPESMQRLCFQNVTYLPLEGTKAKSEFFLAWRRGDPSPSLQNFLKVAKKIVLNN